MYPHEHFGIIAENTNQIISIFDTDTLETFQQIPLEADVIDVSISNNCHRAVVSSFTSKTLFLIDLSDRPARVIGSALSNTFLEDVQITPDGRFALSVDGSAEIQNIVSYSLRKNAIVSALPTYGQAVAASPLHRELVLTAVENADSVRRFTIDRFGILTDTGQTIPAGPRPNNINFSPDGKFAFVADFGGGISVLSTQDPENIVLLGNPSSSTSMQCLAITCDGRHVFGLSSALVEIYSFDPVAGSLTLERSFTHGLNITAFFGVEQIALDHSDTRLFISAIGQVAVFTTYGVPLGTVSGAAGPGGLDICRCDGKRKPDESSPCPCD